MDPVLAWKTVSAQAARKQNETITNPLQEAKYYVLQYAARSTGARRDDGPDMKRGAEAEAEAEANQARTAARKRDRN